MQPLRVQLVQLPILNGGTALLLVESSLTCLDTQGWRLESRLLLQVTDPTRHFPVTV